VFCSQLDDAHCEDCGCPGDLRCDPGKGCIPKSDVGGECRRSSDCMSGNCSAYAHVCRVPLGMVCSAENCDACITSKDPKLGYSYCSRDCSVSSGCEGTCRIGGGGWGLLHGTCTGRDDPSCPVPCEPEVCGGTLGWYCYCQNGCVVSSSPRPDGSFCSYSGQCAGGTCLQAHLPCQSSGFCLDSAGLCTGRCDAMSCGAGLACVELPSTGPVCLPTCDQTCQVGTCRTLASAGGAEVSVCDVRVPEGNRCRFDTDCRSNRCAGDVCVTASGLADGTSCSKDGDCTSGSCRSGQCYGKAVIGEPCSGPYGCAAGTCCQSGHHPNTCQVNCS